MQSKLNAAVLQTRAQNESNTCIFIQEGHRERERGREREADRQREEKKKKTDPLYLNLSHAQQTGVCVLPEVGRFASCVAFRTYYYYYRRMYSIKHRALAVQ